MVSGVLKLMDLGAFTEAVGNFQLEHIVAWGGEERNFFEAPMDAYIAYGLPWFEIIAGAAVATGMGRTGGLIVILAMLLSFNWALNDAWSRGLNINCGCYGKSDNPTNFPLKIASNVGLMIVAAGGLILGWFQQRLASSDGGNTLTP